MALLQAEIQYIQHRTDLGHKNDQPGYQIGVMYENEPGSGGVLEELDVSKLNRLKK